VVKERKSSGLYPTLAEVEAALGETSANAMFEYSINPILAQNAVGIRYAYNPTTREKWVFYVYDTPEDAIQTANECDRKWEGGDACSSPGSDCRIVNCDAGCCYEQCILS
jgi:hypothetical protein